MTTVGFSGLLLLGVLGLRVGVTADGQMIRAVMLLILLLLPIGTATRWTSRRLRIRFSRRETRAMSTTFGLVTPVSLLVAIVLAEIPGGYAAFLGRTFALIGVFCGIVVTTAILNFLACLVTLTMTRRIERLEPTHT